MKNRLYFNRAERAQALLILEGHFSTNRSIDALWVSCWTETLQESLDIRMHDEDIDLHSEAFTRQWGYACHSGNFLGKVVEFYGSEMPHKCIVDEVSALFKSALIDELPEEMKNHQF